MVEERFVVSEVFCGNDPAPNARFVPLQSELHIRA